MFYFNPRARVGRDSFPSRLSSEPQDFNPRARVGRDLHHVSHRVLPAISIHAPAWGATRRTEATSIAAMISIHAPAWGATRSQISAAHFQTISIHAPAWGATPATSKRCGYKTISIHAPAWGATLGSTSCRRCALISIHAPAWGATVHRGAPPAGPRYFNPRARVGRDYSAISYLLQGGNFNPRARVGRDMWISISCGSASTFQSTRPRGARPPLGIEESVAENFNPRARVGRDI